MAKKFKFHISKQATETYNFVYSDDDDKWQGDWYNTVLLKGEYTKFYFIFFPTTVLKFIGNNFGRVSIREVGEQRRDNNHFNLLIMYVVN